MSLIDYLNDNYEKLSKEAKLDIFRQVALAVDYCHSRGVMHRDIKMENILVNVDEAGQVTEVKLADFGFACNAEKLDSEDNFCGSLVFMAPEQLQKNATYDQRADIWSMGHVLFQVLTGSDIFDECESNETNLVNSITKETINFSQYALTLDEQLLLSQMMCIKQSNRISSSEILRNSLFSEQTKRCLTYKT